MSEIHARDEMLVVTMPNTTSRPSMSMRVRTLMRQLVLIAAVAANAHAADLLAPNAKLKADRLPPIPAELAAKVAPYTEFKPATAVSWHPQKRELIVARRAGNTTQLQRVHAPGGAHVSLS